MRLYSFGSQCIMVDRQASVIDTDISLSRTEGKSIVWEIIIKEWKQQQWDQELKGRHLYSLKRRELTMWKVGGK